jgi:UDP-galactopyranose mutase
MARKNGKNVVVIEKRHNTGGNVYCENMEGIYIHKYGPHIFHTDNEYIWDFVNQFTPFKQYTHSPMAYYKGKIYNLPFNMNTFYSFWGITDPNEAKIKIQQQINEAKIKKPKNLEEKAISQVGKDIYYTLIKGYNEKQWGKCCTNLPPFIIERIPVRYTYDNNYFNDQYQGIPAGGYNKLIDGLLYNIEIKTDTNFFINRQYWESIAKKIVYTGRIDKFYNYCFGELDYRTVNFEHETMDYANYQGSAVITFTDAEIPYTRITEHKHFDFNEQPKTIISKEYSIKCTRNAEPFYPINDKKNTIKYNKYYKLVCGEKNIIFGGRLAEYKYLNMDQVIDKALSHFKNNY